MMTDWGSWDGSFNALTASLCDKLVAVANGSGSHVCVPLQGSGTFAVEAAVGTFVPRNGKMLVLVNGAYGKRLAKICEMLGRTYSTYETPEDVPTTPEAVDRLLTEDRAVTHVGLIHCETSTGILNPLPEIAAVVARHGRRLIVDAMSSFGALPIDARTVPFEALIAASGKCLEGVPGMGFVLAREEALLAAEGNSASLALDLRDQHLYMQRTGQWRFTPPTHVVAALHEALIQYEDEGGLPARHARYAKNCETLIAGMGRLGLRSFLPPEIQAPIIVTFHAPRDGRYRFTDFYQAVREKGFILYPGKLTQVETFRVGCIGAVEPADMERAVEAVAQTLRDLNIDTL
jgi:2-aminoethylphosphonate-pyruvate transaminase